MSPFYSVYKYATAMAKILESKVRVLVLSSTDPSTVNIDKPDKDGAILYQCRLWRHFNGSLNWEGLQTLLQRVLTYLMTHPGISLNKLCHVLNPDILPVTTIDVVDILEEIGCVELNNIQKPAKTSLFVLRPRGLSVGESVSLEESVTAINLFIEAPIRLAFFLDLAKKHAKGNSS